MLQLKMNESQPHVKRDSEISHQRQFFWQILVPILISIIVVLILMVLTIISAGNSLDLNEKWAHISTIFLSLPVLLAGLLLLLVIIVLSVMIKKMHKGIPAYTGKLMSLMNSTNRITNITTTKALSPFIYSKAWFAGFNRLLSMAFHRHDDRKE